MKSHSFPEEEQVLAATGENTVLGEKAHKFTDFKSAASFTAQSAG